jgi:hypothetical protein
VTLGPDEKALLLAWPDETVELDELGFANRLGWTHERVRAAMLNLEKRGLVNLSPGQERPPEAPQPQRQYVEAGECRFCGRFLFTTLMDEKESFTIGHQPPVCAEFLAAVGRPPDRQGTIRDLIPLDLTKTKGEA